MASRRSVVAIETKEEELLRMAAERINLPSGVLRLEYEADVDLLAIWFDDVTPSTHSEDDSERGLIYNYAGKQLVSVEVLDLYGTFV